MIPFRELLSRYLFCDDRFSNLKDSESIWEELVRQNKQTPIVKSGDRYTWQLTMSQALLDQINDAAVKEGWTFDVFVYASISHYIAHLERKRKARKDNQDRAK